MINNHPILYSFRRCPYAMRARLVLLYANIRCELREVILRDKPTQMISLSPKATVPILQLPSGQVIDESYDIMKWAIEQNDPDGWQKSIPQAHELVKENDGPFKSALDHYKYPSRFPEQAPEFHRDRGKVFLKNLNHILQSSAYLTGPQHGLADMAIFPFIRQFAHVDKDWFYGLPYPHLHQWLTARLDSDIFGVIMKKYTPWQEADHPVYFPDLHQGSHSPLGATCK